MSVLIMDMEYPQNCGECKLSYNGICVANIGRKVTVDSICPLVEVPPHGRLIDADALEKQIDYVANLDWNIKVGAYGGMLAALEIVEDAPTIIESEGE